MYLDERDGSVGVVDGLDHRLLGHEVSDALRGGHVVMGGGRGGDVIFKGVQQVLAAVLLRTSLRTLAQGMSSGHHSGLQLSLPQPGFPRPVEYFSISGMNARSWA
ncbi:hypothetical protein EYF80_024599 [Liparis tanakae]|uniref:Uncharacterized protein n=1 Tax=Liparis tanakae TaxID=230148 RepID=A0A4Z2HK04_9TELE|nr:hypothetical protein EYF80_024599 [Liparis tanakae]